MVELLNVRIKANFLYHTNNNIACPLVVPAGAVSEHNNFNYFYDDGCVYAKDNNEMVCLYPPYKAYLSFNDNNFNNNLLVNVATSWHERCSANQLLVSHYMGVPNNGLVVVMSNVGTNEIIGCGVLSRLSYSNPKGREEIANTEEIRTEFDRNWNKANRSDVLKKLRVAWISRIVITEQYRGKGLGTLLAQELAIIAGKSLAPTARYVEVITSMPKENAKAIILKPESSFFIKAGYTLYKNLLISKPMCFPDNNGNTTGFETTKKLYYFKKAGE